MVKLDKTYFPDFTEIASVPTNEINLNVHEKRFLQKIMDRTRNVINENFGYQSFSSVVMLENVKNKRRLFGKSTHLCYNQSEKDTVKI